jgi:ribonuclease Z
MRRTTTAPVRLVCSRTNTRTTAPEAQRSLQTTEPTPRSTRLKPLNLSRVFPGPSFNTVHRHRDYYLAFEKSASFSGVPNTGPRTISGQTKMRSYVQFVTTPTADTPGTTLLLHFDSQRYLIGNVAEGTQRACIQRKLGLGKVENIFLTGTTSWATTGGILGMILTLADSTTSSWEERKKALEETARRKGVDTNVERQEKQWLSLHGGKNLTHLLATARRFVFRKGMPVRVNEFRAEMDAPKVDWVPTWQDDRIKVWAMVIDPEARSPKKRTHDEFSEAANSESKTSGVSADEEDRNDQMRKAVVSSMFDSDWRLDALFTKKLSEVSRPAAIFVRDAHGKISKYNGPTLDEDPNAPDIDVLVRNPWPGAKIAELPPTEPVHSSICYFVKNHPQRGKFDPKAARAAGVKPGPDFRLLTEGQSVTTESGAVVTPDMVVGLGKEGSGFAVVELPTQAYVAPLIARQEWSSKAVMDGIGAVIYILGPGVLENPQLQTFMQEHKKLQHVVSSTDCCSNNLALESPASAAIRLHLIDPERFPIPKYSNEIPLPPSENPRPYQKARAGLTLGLEPRFEVQEKDIVHYLDTEAVVKEAAKEVLELAAEGKKQLTSPGYQEQLDKNQADIPSLDAEITALGTGSALPSKYRNVSATLLRVPGHGSYLFDCGENTLGQMRRVYGDEVPAILRDLKAIWISHLHADHHLGTASVIRAWAEETAKDASTKDNKLVVSSDDAMIQWLREYSSVEEYGWERVDAIPINHSCGFIHEFPAEKTTQYGLTKITACLVEHCNAALAVVFDFPNGFKVAYSGDCRPSHRFATIGKGATLLIHEATFDDELQGDAYAKKHSTTSEALSIGRRMEARRILLTHFSQRYQKIPVMDSHGGKDQVAIVAFDYMKVKLKDFAKLDVFKPALMKLYEEKED